MTLTWSGVTAAATATMTIGAVNAPAYSLHPTRPKDDRDPANYDVREHTNPERAKPRLREI